MPNLDDAIREHAYHLWVADGRRDGNADAYWLKAQRDILTTSINDDSVAFAPAPHPEPAASEATYPAKKGKVAKVATPRKTKRRAA